MADDIPQWAKERACALANEQIGRDYWDASEVLNRGMGISGDVMIALAAYIAAHEEAPAHALERAIDAIEGIFEAAQNTTEMLTPATLEAELAKRGLKIVEAA